MLWSFIFSKCNGAGLVVSGVGCGEGIGYLCGRAFARGGVNNGGFK